MSGSGPAFRRAGRQDVPAIVRLLADDQGLGGARLRWAIEQARARGCRLVQLTTDKRRPDALRLYRSLGFQATHEGLKLRLDDP
jgi:GNAT superfamily N-acetyltransferase